MDFELTPEQRALVQSVRDWISKEFDPNHIVLWDEQESYPREEVVKKMRKLGILGMLYPPEYGGQGASFVDYVLCVEELARGSHPLALTLVSSCGGPAAQVRHFASDEIKAKYLPGIAAGDTMCGIAITEANAGSDVGAIQTRATIEGDEVVINGSKQFVGGMGSFELMLVYARLSDDPGTDGVGSILLPTDTPGIRYGPSQAMLGLRAIPRCEAYFEDCRVPVSHIMSKPGEFKNLMNSFNNERIHNAALCVGQGQAAFDEALAYAKSRVQFGRRIGDFQGIRWKLADMQVKLDAARLLTYRAADTWQKGGDARMQTQIAKTFAAEAACQVAHDALQICGANGYAGGSRIGVLYRDIRGHMLGAGSVEITRNYIGRTLVGKA